MNQNKQHRCLAVKTRSQAVARIADRTASQHLWVTWRHRSRDHFIAHMSFHTGSSLEQSRFRDIAL